MTGRGADEEDLDALRRRLYRPDATSDDVRRYTALRVRADRAPVAAAVAPQAARRRPPGRSAVLGGIGLAIAVATAWGLAATAGTPRVEATRSPTPAAVRTLVPADGPSWSIRFNGDTAPSPRPSAGTVDDGTVGLTVDGVAAVVQRFHGVGPGGVALRPTAPGSGGRMLVALTSSAASHLPWRAGAPAADDGSTVQRIVARGTAVTEDRDARPTVVLLHGAPPRWFRVDAPAGAAWRLAVVLLPPAGGPLR